MKKAIGVLAALLFIVFAWYAFQQWRDRPVVDNRSLRTTTAGTLAGFADKHSTHAWLGIPFAQAPLGDLRWRAPQPLPAWQGTRQALAHSEPCAQLALLSVRGDNASTGSEDCLYLNIWAPTFAPEQAATQRLPVMVWIHGGGNTLGFADATQGYQLAGSQQVIVVTLQYRLGVFGWLSHPALRDAAATPADASSNFGLLDQIAGLQWVHDNIAAFGGDPANVTIFGESAGGQDVFALMAAPPAKGLFHRAIAQSGLLRTVPRSAAENFSDDTEPGLPYSSREFLNRLLVADGSAADRAAAKTHQQHMSDAEIASYLRAKSAEQLLAGVTRRSLGMYFAPTVIRDDYVVPSQPLHEIFADPARYNSVPLITGTNRDEYKLFLSSNPELTGKTLGVVPKIKDGLTYNRITGYFSDAWKAQAVDEPAAVLQRSQGDTVFTYRLDWDEGADYGIVDLRNLLGAAHSIDVDFIFGDDATQGLPLRDSANAAGRDALSATMMAYWAHFAKYGVPGNGGRAELPAWRPWSATEPSLMVFDTAQGGGVRISDDRLFIADLKQRLQTDPLVDKPIERCRLYVQLFHVGLSDTYWNESEYDAWGCGVYPYREFKAIF
jgi:para-nitrobenzyl esterase